MKKYLAIALLSGTFFLTGCGDDRDDFVFTNLNQNVGVAPVCANDSYSTAANTVLNVNAAAGVLANDSPAGAPAVFPATSTQGGTVVGAANGSFTYTPRAGFSGTDTFTYSLTNSFGTVQCSVSINVTAVNGFFVDAVNGNDATGSFTGGRPFATIQTAVNLAPVGADIVVQPGTYTGGITLKNGQRLLGSGSTAIVPQGAVRPVLSGPIVLGDGNTVDFLRVAGTAGDAIDGNGQNSGRVTNCEIANTSNNGAGVVGDGASGTWTVSNNTISNFAGIGVTFRTTGNAELIIEADNNTISAGRLGAMAFVSGDTSSVVASIVGNTFTGNNTVTGNAFEIVCGQSSRFCLDLENNTNDDVYSLGESSNVESVLSVEELATLTASQPGGAGNTGTVFIIVGPTAQNPTPVPDGFCTIGN